MTSEHTTEHTPSDMSGDMSSDVSTQRPLTTAADALWELKHDSYTAACAGPSMTGCISAALEQIGQLQTQLDAQTLATDELGEYLRHAREKLEALRPVILQGEDDAYEAEIIINHLAEKVRVASLQRGQNQGENK